MKGNSELAKSAQRMDEIVANSKYLENYRTVYNWGDVQEGEDSLLERTQGRRYAFSARDIRHYLDLSSDHHRVMMLFRGHQHGFQHLMDEGRVLTTTLPVGMDSPGYRDRFDQPDRAYIIKPAAQVADWQKRAILRAKLQPSTDEITPSYPLVSPAI
jgi:hypothetical protein